MNLILNNFESSLNAGLAEFAKAKIRARTKALFIGNIFNRQPHLILDEYNICLI